jgi:hypothetical protein
MAYRTSSHKRRCQQWLRPSDSIRQPATAVSRDGPTAIADPNHAPAVSRHLSRSDPATAPPARLGPKLDDRGGSPGAIGAWQSVLARPLEPPETSASSGSRPGGGAYASLDRLAATHPDAPALGVGLGNAPSTPTHPGCSRITRNKSMPQPRFSRAGRRVKWRRGLGPRRPERLDMAV